MTHLSNILQQFSFQHKIIQYSYLITIWKVKIINDQHFTKKKYANFGPKSQSTTKNRMLGATNLHESREFYTNAVDDVGDI